MEPHMNQSINDYRFVSDEEPGDENLNIIMHEVALEAKEIAVKVKEKIKTEIKKQLQVALKREGFISK